MSSPAVSQSTLVEFKDFNAAFQAHFRRLISDDGAKLFCADVDKEVLWNLYLDSFPPGTNERFRERREYDCSCCRSFIKELGGLVIMFGMDARSSIWGFDAPAQFAPVVAALDEYVNACPIRDIYRAPQVRIGTERNFDDKLPGNHVWHHFFLDIPKAFVHRGNDSRATLYGNARTSVEVFTRALTELSSDATKSVLELIQQGSLYRGDEWRRMLEEFLNLQCEFDTATSSERELITWGSNAGPALMRIRNSAVGTLLIDISEGVELDEAVRRYEKVVAPANYKRPKAIFTPKMVEAAQAKVEELGLLSSLGRRFATLDDVSVADVLFVDRDAAPRMSGGDVFSDMKKASKRAHSTFGRAETVSRERFIADILPTASKIEVLFESKHAGNLVSLIAPKDTAASSLFRWSNGFSWAYAGNVADSTKELVKAAGGSVDGVLRFSIRWNDGNTYNGNDFDAHCVEPNGERIYYLQRRNPRSRGELDVDIITPSQDKPAVENITWPSRTHMEYGEYVFTVHTFTHRGGTDGFAAEIEFDGEVHEFEVRRPTRSGEYVEVARVQHSRDGFKLVSSINEREPTSREIWGMKTRQFQRVNFISHSPNFWHGESGAGNQHLFFMLADCRNPDTPNGFYNEFLRPELAAHKRVFEALGSRMKVEPDERQLSGIGFSSTKRDTLVCRVTGTTTRVINIAL